MADTTATMEADVLIIGGGLAGGWAAIAAAREGASVLLVDKGYFGTSGVTATAGPNHWWVPPDPELRATAIRDRHARGLGLSDPRWMARIIETTWNTLPGLQGYYQFSTDQKGAPVFSGLRGPEYLRALRLLAQDLGVHVLDQHPATELLLHPDGSAAGARGIRRQQGGSEWTIRSGAVILASGGCGFMSRLLGSQTNTGDGLLMAAEAGAHLSGMEFSSAHTVAPAFSTQARAASYSFATYYDAAGRDLHLPPHDMLALAKALIEGPVYCDLARMPADLRAILPQIQPAVLLTFHRQGIDPFTQRFEVTLRCDGTIRGTGGLDLIDDDCQTAVRGLFAAGDVASRERVAGAITGGGAQNAAWGLSSGPWSGKAAAQLARHKSRKGAGVEAAGAAGLRPLAGKGRIDPREIIGGMQREMLPFDKMIFRSAPKLQQSLGKLDQLWRDSRDHAMGTTGLEVVKAREAAALVANARWAYRAALNRVESRGLHYREDAPQSDPAQHHRQLIGGLDTIWLRSQEDRPSEVA